MKCLNLALVVAIISGCASNKVPVVEYYPTYEEYEQVASKYKKKLDLQWVKKFAENPQFGKDFDKCRNENEIAQWFDKYFYVDMTLCLDLLKTEWSEYLKKMSVRYSEDSYLLGEQLIKVEESFRKDILDAYVQRHQFYARKGLIQQR